MTNKVSSFEQIDTEQIFGGSGFYQLSKPLTGFKKIRCKFNLFGTYIETFDTVAELEMPIGAQIVVPETTDKKMRADRATVKNIDAQTDLTWLKCFSIYDNSYLYKVGELKTPEEEFDTDRLKYM